MAFEHAPYHVMLSPLTIGDLTLRNRVVMGSMHTGLEDHVWDVDKLAAYYAERANGGVGLIITGGFSPNRQGWLKPLASEMTSRLHAERHKRVTAAVHEHGGAIAMQILHAGRYAYLPWSVSASAIKAPINPFTPRALSARGVDRTITDFADAARLAQRAGYDAVEIMGSEGYLINQFLAARTNTRSDRWGGSARKRMEFPLEILRRTRERVGEDFPIIYRISLLDLVEGGQTWDEIEELAGLLQEAGASVFNTGIGWHEARVPTIITQVPAGAWTWATARLKAAVDIPVCASNRINSPEMVEEILQRGDADLVSMARPLLTDPDFVRKAEAKQADEINICIACNQACLDQAFVNEKVTCLLNPRAGRETELMLMPVARPRTLAVVGAGPAGLSTALAHAERGFQVTLFEKETEVGGQFRLAMQIPGKEEFAKSLRYYCTRLTRLGVDVRLGTTATAAMLTDFDEVVIATGVEPRIPAIEGVDHRKVVSYADVLNGTVTPGRRVAVIGAGGIGVDVSVWLTHRPDESLSDWLDHWGVSRARNVPGALVPPTPRPAIREVWLLQRKSSAIGNSLGKTTGWAHRTVLKQTGVNLVTGVTYDRIDDAGLHLTANGIAQVLDVQHVVLCAGQESARSLYDELVAEGREPALIGGAELADELDAKRAIRQGVELAAGRRSEARPDVTQHQVNATMGQ